MVQSLQDALTIGVMVPVSKLEGSMPSKQEGLILYNCISGFFSKPELKTMILGAT